MSMPYRTSKQGRRISEVMDGSCQCGDYLSTIERCAGSATGSGRSQAAATRILSAEEARE
jgi:hypothetical protein